MLKKYFSGKDTPFWLLTFSIVALLTLSRLIKDGMFMDGMLYTCVSHNLSKGIGTFWFPVFSPSYHNSGSPFFMEHPPLVFGIQSIFFRILGDSMYVERIYIFLTMCITAFLIHHLWQSIFKKDKELKKISWLPILLWITIPSSSWSYINNMMENSMGIFTLGAVICIFKSFESQKHKFSLLFLSGFLVFSATMSKGVPGLFPLSVPFLHWLIIRKKSLRNALLSTLLIVLVPAVFYFILFHFPQSRESLKFYITERLLRRINENPTVGSRFYIMKRLFMELIPIISLVIVAIVFSRIRKLNIQHTGYFRYALFFLSIGLAASVPMILTHVQRGFYLVPSFPYFAIGFSIILVPLVLLARENLSNNPRNHRIFIYVSSIVFVFSLAFAASQKGKTERDKDMLHDVYAIGKEIPENSTVSITEELAAAYVLECYFIRYFNIGLFANEQKDYYLTSKTSDFSNNAYEKLKLETRLYDIYKRKRIN